MGRYGDTEQARRNGGRASSRARRARAAAPPRAATGVGAMHPGAEYDAEQADFLKACDRYRTARGIPFLTATDYLAIAKGLGYARPAGDPP